MFAERFKVREKTIEGTPKCWVFICLSQVVHIFTFFLFGPGFQVFYRALEGIVIQPFRLGSFFFLTGMVEGWGHWNNWTGWKYHFRLELKISLFYSLYFMVSTYVHNYLYIMKKLLISTVWPVSFFLFLFSFFIGKLSC